MTSGFNGCHVHDPALDPLSDAAAELGRRSASTPLASRRCGTTSHAAASTRRTAVSSTVSGCNPIELMMAFGSGLA